MDDFQKWLEAAAGLEQDLEYLKISLLDRDVEYLKIALAVYKENAETGVPWPNPDDLYCILTFPHGSQTQVSTDMRRSFKTAC